MSVELKPCPFCGGKAKMQTWFDPYVTCETCRAHAEVCVEVVEAAEAWNHRTDSGALTRIAELELQLKQANQRAESYLARAKDAEDYIDESGT